ncbi:hypothetical protein N7494_005156 [Penicillium frequentans]|uniref:Uncharacterized protein n=1 Tax=Penicillium frequentans TaxID=3151616 RepID=A0AAD6CXN2_9EURO|nr:hypothetical protein N7494_005156 [Penicillium glabrum]
MNACPIAFWSLSFNNQTDIMGRVLNVSTTFRRKPGTQKFELNHVPLRTPQSALDKKVLYPNRKPPQGGNYHRSLEFVGNFLLDFTSPDDPDLRLDEMQLKLYRKLSFQPIFENGRNVYKLARAPPLECITSQLFWKTPNLIASGIIGSSQH